MDRERPPDPSTPAAAVPRAVPATPALREQLVDAWLARLHGAAYALTGRAADAEDLVQEAFLRALRAPELPLDPAVRGPWLLTILRHAHTDRLRRLGVERRVAAGVLRDAARRREPGSAAPEPSEAAPSFLRLPEDERLVCWLRLVADQPFRAIADLLGTSKSAVDRTYRRGLARLRDGGAP